MDQFTGSGQGGRTKRNDDYRGGQRMTENTVKRIEDVVRRAARGHGLRLTKSRNRDTRAADYGTYGLVDDSNVVVAGDLTTGHGLDLETVAAEVGIKVVYGTDGVPRIHHSTEWDADDENAGISPTYIGVDRASMWQMVSCYEN